MKLTNLTIPFSWIKSDNIIKSFGHKDITKLQKKQIINKKGKNQTVYVSNKGSGIDINSLTGKIFKLKNYHKYDTSVSFSPSSKFKDSFTLTYKLTKVIDENDVKKFPRLKKLVGLPYVKLVTKNFPNKVLPKVYNYVSENLSIIKSFGHKNIGELQRKQIINKKGKKQTVYVKNLENEYIRKIPKKFKVNIEKYIHKPEIQVYVKKAKQGNLTKEDSNKLFKIGSHNSKEYPHLYWLTNIYIHPLTKLSGLHSNLVRLSEKIDKKIKNMKK